MSGAENGMTDGTPEGATGGADGAYERFRAFRALHHGTRPLLLPNAWDHASAAALHRRGFPAVGTTSLGIAAAAGLPDGSGAARGETLELGRGLARLPVPVSVDVEGGFSDDPAEVAALGAELARAGVAGVNVEDGRSDGTLTDPALHAAKVTALKEAAPYLFVNARTDTHWLGTDPTTAGALRRCAAYVRAGADGVFVPGLVAADDIAALAGELGTTPLNVLYSPAHHTWDALTASGAARVSLGSLLYRAALGRAVELACAIAGPDGPAAGTYGGGAVPPYAEVEALHGDFGP
ncbi:2-methylisocitrate lyase-like PEP mutase family enzyme [Streptomyces sp. Amel2xB2]|uniref:isocitrate lyase/PEP mutase family protein n=1 Tax=Streptomyces sp. Amel2xB2 TaxID=1305829 RepID=UPI000DBF7FEC|nr:isocitrate lyase/phosphoenolpyruvate mutase family protein [Streptomyces sp. Amel2xB2]RAJ58847.1 2-methylisocitrate lyase-like PEP mutase family enzyme [Streptomyces sp. Amel2xB2]